MPNADETKFTDRYSLRKMLRRLMYVLLVVVVFFIVKAKFLTPPEVVGARIGKQDVTAEVQGTGTVAVDVLATVGAKIPGRIARVFVDQGDFVRKGQIVAELEDTDIRQDLEGAEARLAAARAQEEAARATVEARRATQWQTGRDWEREKHLVATGAVSQEEADQYEEQDLTAASAVAATEAEVGAAKREAEAAEAGVRFQQFVLSETKIFSYVSGVVIDLPKRPGDAVIAGEPVVTIADPKVTMVDAFVDQRFSGEISKGQPATVILRGRTNSPYRGRVYRVSPQADPATEEMTVEVTFPLSPEELEIGQWADVYIQVGEAKNALVVPQSAVMTLGGGRFVLVVGSGGRVRQVKVEPLASSPRFPVVAVNGDLKPEDWVLIKPMGIRAGQRVRVEQSHAVGGAP